VSDKYERKYPDLKVYVGSSVWRNVEALHMAALLPLLRDGARYVYLPQTGDAMMERTRGMSATLFLKRTKGDVWLSLDSDVVGFTKDNIDELCEQAVTHDIVCGIYICRSINRTFPSSAFEDESTIEFGSDSTPVPIKWGATGCMAVHRRVFEKMAETMPLLHAAGPHSLNEGKCRYCGIGSDEAKDNPLCAAGEERAFYDFFETMQYDEPEHGLIKLSEDFSFCQRAKELGFTTYANPSIRLGHMGPYIYRLEDMAQEVLEPQPLAISRSGPYWRIECERRVQTPEAQGRIKAGQREEIEQRFNGKKKRPKVPSGA
jgi:hypothetical protein